MKTPDYFSIEFEKPDGKRVEDLKDLEVGDTVKVMFSKHHYRWHYYKVTTAGYKLTIEKVKDDSQ